MPARSCYRWIQGAGPLGAGGGEVCALPKVGGPRPLPPGWQVAGQVATASDEHLVALLRARPDLVVAAGRGQLELAKAMQAPESLKAFYKAANRATRQVMETLCLVPEPVEPQRLAELLRCPAPEVAPVLDVLRQAWIVVDGDNGLALNPGLRAALPRPCGLGPPLRHALHTVAAADLSKMAQRLGLSVRGTKVDLVTELTAALSDPARVAKELSTAPAATAELAQCLALGANASELVGEYNLYNSLRSERSPIGWLVARGMVVALQGMWEVAMPAEVALMLRGGCLFEEPFTSQAPALECHPVDLGAVERHASAVALALVADVAKLADAWAVAPAKLLQSGGLGIREMRRAAKLMGRTDADGTRVIELVDRAALVGRDLNDGVALPSEAYDTWVAQPVALRWAELVLAWWASPKWLSLAGCPDENGKPIPAMLEQYVPPLGARARDRRAAVLNLLGQVPDRQGTALGSLAYRLLWQQPSLWEGGPTTPDDLVKWAVVEAELLGLVAPGGPGLVLSPLGRTVVRLMAGQAAPGGEQAVLAAALEPACPAPCSEIVLQADLTAVAAGELPRQLKVELDLLADVESEGAATVYRFSEASLRRAFDGGRRATEILAFLGEHAPRGIPQPLAYLVDDINRRFGEVRAGTARSYVRSDDPAILATAVRAKKLAGLNLRPLAPTVAVSDAEWPTLVRALRDAGYMVAAEEADGSVVALGAVPPRRATGVRRTGIGNPSPGFSGHGPRAQSSAAPPTLEDAVQVVANLRKMAREVVDIRSAARRVAAQSGQLELLEPRPTQIAKEVTQIERLVVDAFVNDWGLRLCYVNGQGTEAEYNVEVLDLQSESFSARRPANGSTSQLMFKRVRWARVLTEAEESLQGSSAGAQ